MYKVKKTDPIVPLSTCLFWLANNTFNPQDSGALEPLVRSREKLHKASFSEVKVGLPRPLLCPTRWAKNLISISWLMSLDPLPLKPYCEREPYPTTHLCLPIWAPKINILAWFSFYLGVSVRQEPVLCQEVSNPQQQPLLHLDMSAEGGNW